MTITRIKTTTNIKHLLANNQSKFTALIEKSKTLEHLNKVFSAIINNELSQHCYIVDSTGTIATLLVDNSAWATVLHLQATEIIKNLQTQPEFKQLRSIKCKVKRS